MMKLLGVGCTAVSRRESRCCWEHHSGYERVRAGLLLGALVCFAITTTFAQAPSSLILFCANDKILRLVQVVFSAINLEPLSPI